MTISTRYDVVPDGKTATPSTLWLMPSFCNTSVMAVAAMRAASSLTRESNSITPFCAFAQNCNKLLKSYSKQTSLLNRVVVKRCCLPALDGESIGKNM